MPLIRIKYSLLVQINILLGCMVFSLIAGNVYIYYDNYLKVKEYNERLSTFQQIDDLSIQIEESYDKISGILSLSQDLLGNYFSRVLEELRISKGMDKKDAYVKVEQLIYLKERERDKIEYRYRSGEIKSPSDYKNLKAQEDKLSYEISILNHVLDEIYPF